MSNANPDRSNWHGKKGKSGRKPAHIEKKFWKRFDRNLPEVVSYLMKIIREADSKREELEDLILTHPFHVKDVEEEKREWSKLGIKAATTLLSKAPQRIEGTGDEGKIMVRLDF